MIRAIVGIFICSIVAMPLPAQAISTDLAQSGKPISSQVVPEQISVAFDNVLLKEAVWTIARRSGTRVVFDGDLLPAKRVSYRADGVPPNVALAAVLEGTGVNVVRANNGTFKLMPSTSSKRRVDGVIVGKISDSKTSKGLQGVSVSAGSETRATVTGEDGSYRLTGIPSGTHTLSIRLIGYARQSRQVTVGDGATVTADFKLDPSANVLDQIIVTGTVAQTELKAVPNAITVITAKQIEDRGITRIDQLFRGDVPGLFVRNSGSASLVDNITMFSRGATSIPNNANLNSSTTPIKTYIDGVEMAESKYLSQIDPKSIERIEILTGPQASTIYGSNAINGVMQIFTKRGRSSRPQITASMLSGFVESNFSKARTPQHDYSVQVNGVERSISYNVGGAWNYIGPWTPAKQTTRTSIFGGARIELPTPAGRITTDMTLRRNITHNRQYGHQTQRMTGLYETGWYAPVNGMGLTTPAKQNLTGQTLGFVMTYSPLDWWSHELEVGQDVSDFEHQYRAQGFRTISDTSLQLQQVYSHRKSIRYTNTARASIFSFAQAMLTVGADSWQSTSSNWTIFPQVLTGSLTGSTSISRQPGHNAGGFFQTQIGFNDQLFITYGLRAEWNPAIGAEALPNYAPRYGLAYTQEVGAVTTKLRGSFGRSTRPPLQSAKLEVPFSPDMTPYYGSILQTFANPDLLPEIQQGWEGGMEMYVGNIGSLVVTRYNQTVDDLISYVNVDSSDVLNEWKDVFGCGDWQFGCYVYQNQALNIGTIRNQGWELQGSIHIGPFVTRGTYNWTKSRVLGITPKYRALLTESKYLRGATFNTLAEHTWAVGLTYAKGANTIGLNANGIGSIIIGRQDDFYFKNLADNIRVLSNRLRLDPVYYYGINGSHVIMDMTASRKFSPKLDGVLQIFNLADLYQKNEASGSYVTMGRQAKIGARWRGL